MEDFKLFIKVLTLYHQKCIKNDLPLNMILPILGNIDFLLDELHFNELNVEKRLILLCKRIEKISDKTNFFEVFLMYSVLKTIEEKHDYFIATKEDIVKASNQSAADPEQEAGDEYWLTAWPPSKVANNPELFIEKVLLSKQIFLEETKELRYVLYNMVFQPPFGIPKTWSILRCEDSL